MKISKIINSILVLFSIDFFTKFSAGHGGGCGPGCAGPGNSPSCPANQYCQLDKPGNPCGPASACTNCPNGEYQVATSGANIATSCNATSFISTTSLGFVMF